MNVPLSEAEKSLADLVARAEAGERIVLTRNGKPVAELAPTPDTRSDAEKRRAAMGKYRDQIWIAPDFDELGPEWDEYIK